MTWVLGAAPTLTQSLELPEWPPWEPLRQTHVHRALPGPSQSPKGKEPARWVGVRGAAISLVPKT